MPFDKECCFWLLKGPHIKSLWKIKDRYLGSTNLGNHNQQYDPLLLMDSWNSKYVLLRTSAPYFSPKYASMWDFSLYSLLCAGNKCHYLHFSEMLSVVWLIYLMIVAMKTLADRQIPMPTKLLLRMLYNRHFNLERALLTIAAFLG